MVGSRVEHQKLFVALVVTRQRPAVERILDLDLPDIVRPTVIVEIEADLHVAVARVGVLHVGHVQIVEPAIPIVIGAADVHR